MAGYWTPSINAPDMAEYTIILFIFKELSAICESALSFRIFSLPNAHQLWNCREVHVKLWVSDVKFMLRSRAILLFQDLLQKRDLEI